MKSTNLNQQRDYEGLVKFCTRLLGEERAKKVADNIFIEDYPILVERYPNPLDAYKALLIHARTVCLVDMQEQPPIQALLNLSKQLN